MSDSPFLLMKKLEAQLQSVLRNVDVYALDKAGQKLVNKLKQEIIDVRLDIRDYELSETRDEQLRNAVEAKHRLEQLRKNVLAASEIGMFSAVDVAQIGAELEQIAGLLV